MTVVLLVPALGFLPRKAVAQERLSGTCSVTLHEARTLYEADRGGGTAAWSHFSERLVSGARTARQCLQAAGAEAPVWLLFAEARGLHRQQRHAEAVERYTQALHRAQAAGDAATVQAIRFERGEALYRLSRYLEALGDYAQAVERSALLPLVEQGYLFRRYASTLAEVQRPHEALAQLQRAHAAYERIPEAERDAVYYQGQYLALSRHLDLLVHDLKRYETGEERAFLLDLANRIEEAARRQGDADTQAFALAKKVDVLSVLDRHDEAVRVARRVLSLASEEGVHPWYRMMALRKLGEALHAAGQHREAAQLLEQAYAAAASYSGGELDYMRWSAHSLGATLEALGDGVGAARWYEHAIELTEVVRGYLGATEWSSAAFAEMLSPYRALVRLHLQAGRTDEAFLLLDQTRARTLRDLMLRARLRYSAPPHEQQRVDSLHALLVDLHHDLLRPGLSGDARSHLQAQVLHVQNDLAALHTGLRTTLELEVPTLQQRLRDERRVLLTYFLDGRGLSAEQSASYALLVTPDTLLAHRLAMSTGSLAALVDQLVPRLRADEGALQLAQVDLRLAHRLYDVLVGPVAQHLREGDRLLVVPEGPLRRLPFGMLVEQPVGRYAYREAPYLLRRHAVTVDVAALPAVVRPPSRPLGLAAYGVRDHRSHAALPDLPGAFEEVQRISRQLAGSIVRTDERATEPHFYHDFERSSVVHMATHALADARDPLTSALFLHPLDEAADAPPEHDGIVHVYELQQLHAKVPLIVLSACNTAGGRQLLGEGVEGFTHAFRAVGAQSLLAMLWDTNDRTTVGIMEDFYAGLAEGLPLDEALRRAQLAYIDEASTAMASPFFWAAPVLSGSAAPVEVEEASLLPWTWLLLSGVLSLPAFWYFRRRTHA